MENEKMQMLPLPPYNSAYYDDEDDDGTNSVGRTYELHRNSTALCGFMSLLIFALTTSLVFNFIVVMNSNKQERTSISTYLRVPTEQPDTLWWTTNYSGTNEPEVDDLWMNSIPWESGIIALHNEEAKALGLPESQPWPWDGNQKSIYIINAHHILHCVRNLYISIQEYRQNKPQSVEWPHILHCLDSIRQDTMCSADDTPRYVPLNSVHGFRPGDGQKRTCRNWDAVQRYVEAHDPCYKYIQPGNKQLSNLERFKYCPDDSEYIPIIRKFFGYSDDWLPSKASE